MKKEKRKKKLTTELRVAIIPYQGACVETAKTNLNIFYNISG